jgi:hypothetical protein
LTLGIAETEGEEVQIRNYNAADCSRTSGVITVHQWGDAPNQPFRIEVDATLGDPERAGETRDLVLDGNGTIVVL